MLKPSHFKTTTTFELEVAAPVLVNPRCLFFKDWFYPNTGRSKKIHLSTKSNQRPSDQHPCALTTTPLWPIIKQDK